MEQDILRSAWLNMAAEPKKNTQLRHMISASNHPLLKRIRKQLIIETIVFTLFLLVYYDFFDGDRKPLYTNVLLVVALLFLLIHNLVGFVLMKYTVKGDNIRQLLTDHLLKIKTYAIVSVLSRVLVAGCLLFFFMGTIRFTTMKTIMLVTIILVFMIQIAFLSRIWIKRIRQLKGTIRSFDLDI